MVIAIAAIIMMLVLSGISSCADTGEPETPAAVDTSAKYSIASGIIVYETRNEMLAAINEKWTYNLYFDDYGCREVKETYVNGILIGKVVDDGIFHYELNFDKKVGIQEKSTSLGTEMPFAPEKYPGANLLSNLNVAGKNCRAFSIEEQSIPAVTTIAGWNGIILMHEMKFNTGDRTITDTTIATAIQVNNEIPASVFEIPQDFQIYKSEE